MAKQHDTHLTFRIPARLNERLKVVATANFETVPAIVRAALSNTVLGDDTEDAKRAAALLARLANNTPPDFG